MDIAIIFNDIEAISENISEPDILSVKFLLPGLFIDTELLEPLDKASHRSEVEIKPQLS